jgi:hypothetical protein
VETVHGANRLFATVNLLQIIAYVYSGRNKGRCKDLVTVNIWQLIVVRVDNKALVTVNNLQTKECDDTTDRYNNR